MEGLESDSHRDSVVIVSHATSTQMSCHELDFHLGADFHFEDVGKVAQLMCTTADKLVKIDKLRHFLLLGRETSQKWVFILTYFVLVLPVCFNSCQLVFA